MAVDRAIPAIACRRLSKRSRRAAPLANDAVIVGIRPVEADLVAHGGGMRLFPTLVDRVGPDASVMDGRGLQWSVPVFGRSGRDRPRPRRRRPGDEGVACPEEWTVALHRRQNANAACITDVRRHQPPLPIQPGAKSTTGQPLCNAP